VANTRQEGAVFPSKIMFVKSVEIDKTMSNVKLPAHKAGLPGKEISFILCPITPPTRRGLRGTCRSKLKVQIKLKFQISNTEHLTLTHLAFN
jgi:hypothetical protein